MFAVSLGVDREGKQLFTSSASGDIRIWDADTLEQLGAKMHHDSQAHQVAWSHDHQRLFSGHKDGSIRVWDLRTGGLLGPPWWHRKEVVSLAVRPDDSRMLTASADWSAKLWNIGTESEDVDAVLRRLQRATGVARSADGSLKALSIDEWKNLDGKRP